MPAVGARFPPSVRPSPLRAASPATRWSRSTSSLTSKPWRIGNQTSLTSFKKRQVHVTVSQCTLVKTRSPQAVWNAIRSRSRHRCLTFCCRRSCTCRRGSTAYASREGGDGTRQPLHPYRCASSHQRSRHVHHHQWLALPSPGEAGHVRGVALFRSARRDDGRDRCTTRQAYRRRVGHCDDGL